MLALDYFPVRVLTSVEKEHFVQLSRNMAEEMDIFHSIPRDTYELVHDVDGNLNGDATSIDFGSTRAGNNNARWKYVMDKNGLSFYCDASETIVPVMHGVGKVKGELHEIGAGLICTSSRAYRHLGRILYGSAFVDGQVVYTIVHQNRGNEVVYVGIKWLALKMKSSRRVRDFVFLEYIGSGKNQNNEKVYFRYCQSLHLQDIIPHLLDTHGYLRCSILRETQWYKTATSTNDLKVNITFRANLFMPLPETAQCMIRYITSFSAMEHYLLSNRITKLPIQSNHSTSNSQCTTCHRPFRIYRSSIPCSTCGTSICTTCSLPVLHPNCPTPLTICHRCLLIPPTQRIYYQGPYTDCTSILVSGSFCQWSMNPTQGAKPMHYENGTWTATIPVRGITYYKFFINQQFWDHEDGRSNSNTVYLNPLTGTVLQIS